MEELIQAIIKNNIKRVKKLLKENSNLTDSSLLSYAENNPKILQLLLEAGIDPNTPEYAGNTPIMLNENLEILQLLLDYGGDINAQNDEGMTALNQDSISEEKLKFILEKGADPNIPDFEGITPLSKAVIYDDIARIKMLLEYGADPKLKNKGGFAPQRLIRLLFAKKPNQRLIEKEISRYLCSIFKIKGHAKGQASNIQEKYENNEEIYQNVEKRCPQELRKVQRSMPFPLFKDFETFPSGRTVNSLDYLFEEVRYRPKTVKRSKVEYFKSIEDTPTCFCLNEEPGVYENMYIPVITYRPSLGQGYYSFDKVNPEETRFLFYYWEPESPYFLYSPKSLVSRNKVHAYYKLISEKKGRKFIDKKLKDFEDALKYRKINLSIKEFLNGLEKPEKSIRGNRFSTWLRFEPGGDGIGNDDFDREVGKLAIELGYDCIIFTHQAGNYGRLVSEVLDVRTRSESIRNIAIAK